MNRIEQSPGQYARTILSLLIGLLAGCGGGGNAIPPSSTGGSGSTSGSASLPTGTELLYVGDNAGAIHGFGVDPGSGKLTPLPPSSLTVQAASGDVGLAADPGGKVLYAAIAGVGHPNVLSFIVNTATGALDPTGTVTLSVPARKVASIEANLYVIPDPSANVAQMFAFGISSINASLGQLSPSITLPASAHDLVIAGFGNGAPSWMGLTFDGTSGGEIQGILRQPNAGATGLKLTTPSSSGGSSPQCIRVTPDGKFVTVTNQGSNNVAVFSLDATTGALTQVPGSPFVTGTQPGPIAIDPPSSAALTPPAGKFVFVGNTGASSLSVYTIGSTGSLTPVPGSPVTLGTNAQPSSIAVDPAGKFVYVSLTNEQITGFAVDTNTGALTPLTGSPFSVSFGTRDIVFVP